MRAIHILQSAIASVCFLTITSLGLADDPIAQIAVVSNPYVTTLSADEIVDERGAARGFLAKTGRESMLRTAQLLEQIEPDALVVLGSLTWTGTEAEWNAFAQLLEPIKAPTFIVPGHRDQLADPGLEAYRRRFKLQDATNQIKAINGVSLAFSSDLHTDPDAATARLETQLSTMGKPKAVLLFSDRNQTMGRSRLQPTHERFWRLVADHKISAQLEPTRYGHAMGQTNSLPLWNVGSNGWSTRGAVTLVRVYRDRIELAEIDDPSQPAFSLSVPNTTNSPRITTVEDDPYACPSYSQDLSLKPDFTFGLVSDPQFDREANRDYLIAKAQAAISELNRLRPSMVYVAGDLVNNNLPEEWTLFNRVFAKLEPRHYVVPGNHDVLFNYDFMEQAYASAPRKNPEYASTVKRALANAEQEGFSGSTALYEKHTGAKPRQLVEHQDCAFIMVPFLTTRADEEQIEFLEQQLKATRDKDHVFVVAHYPILSAFGNNVQPQLGGARVLSLLHEHRVSAYLFGHRHRNGFRLHERTAHVLTDNMSSIHLIHVFSDRLIVCRKRVGSPLYEKLTVPSPRK